MQQPVVPVLLSLHVEPDERVVRETDARWSGFANVAAHVRASRARFEDATGHPVHFNWCVRLDPQVAVAFGSPDWILKRHETLFDQLVSEGDAIGLHVHCWRPVRRWFRRTWLADHADDAWAEHCIRMAHDAFVSHFGRRPAIASMGDHYMSRRTMALFGELGIRADSSMYPGMAPVKRLVESERARGSLPDYRGIPDRPFKPSIADFTRPGSQHHGVWEVPVSAGTVRHPISRADVHTHLLLGAMPDGVAAIVAQNLARPAPYLHAEARTDVRLNADNRERFDWSLDYLARLGRERALRIMTVEAFCDALDRGERVGGAAG